MFRPHLKLLMIFSQLFQLAVELTQRLAERSGARDGFLQATGKWKKRSRSVKRLSPDCVQKCLDTIAPCCDRRTRSLAHLAFLLQQLLGALGIRMRFPQLHGHLPDLSMQLRHRLHLLLVRRQGHKPRQRPTAGLHPTSAGAERAAAAEAAKATEAPWVNTQCMWAAGVGSSGAAKASVNETCPKARNHAGQP
jgi:hypothetical protein